MNTDRIRTYEKQLEREAGQLKISCCNPLNDTPFDEANTIAPAICYELSNEEHAAHAHKMNANIYMASVLNSVNGVDADIEKLSKIASTYKMITFMSNYIGTSGGYECAGKSVDTIRTIV